MKLIDSNILIYAARPEFLHIKEMIEKENVAVSEISRLEVMGYHRITEEQKDFFKAIFLLVQLIPVDEQIIDKAIIIRQTKNVKIGDAIIAATAVLNSYELVTRNTGDFSHITEIVLNNPIDQCN